MAGWSYGRAGAASPPPRFHGLHVVRTQTAHVCPCRPSARRLSAAGLNPLFDTFDCQAHYFASPEAGALEG